MSDAQPEPVDRAIADWLRYETQRSMREVIACGPPALLRTIRIYYLGDVCPAVEDISRTRRGSELRDAWAVLLGGLARAYPQIYLDEIDAGRVRLDDSPTLVMVILGSIELPGAVDVLCRYRNHPNWLVRSHVIHGLGRRDDPASIEAVSAAVTDAHQQIRDEAARWLQRGDPVRASERYHDLLADPDLAPAMRAELARRVSEAKRLATQRQRRLTR